LDGPKECIPGGGPGKILFDVFFFGAKRGILCVEHEVRSRGIKDTAKLGQGAALPVRFETRIKVER
jgi:hypothetical protein